MMDEDPEASELVNDEDRQQFCRILDKVVLSALLPLYILFQLFRLASLVMFSIFMVDCTLYHGTTSVDCQNFTVYTIPMCDGYCWKIIWLSCSILTSTICICLLSRSLLPDLRPVGYSAIWKCLLRKPYFGLLTSPQSLLLFTTS